MKKLKYILICFSVLLLSLSGLSFLNTNNFVLPTDIAVETSKIEYNSGEDIPDDDELDNEQTFIEPTVKEYSAYFDDFNIADDTITVNDVSGNGTVGNPYKIHTLNGFLWFFNADLCDWWINGKYVELDCDIILNDETFNNEGKVIDGDGVVYKWQPITNAANLHFNCNNYKISGFYINDTSLVSASLFAVGMKEIENLVISNFFLQADKIVSALSSGGFENVTNVHIESGYFHSNRSVFGICNTVNYIENCSSKAEIFQHAGTEKESVCGIAKHVYKEAKNCVNYGNIKSEYTSYVGGLFANVYETNAIIENCINYGDIYDTCTSVTAVGGVSARCAITTIKNCVNYGSIYTDNVSYLKGAGIIGGCNRTTIRDCINYGSVRRGAGITGGGDMAFIYDCINYGTIYHQGAGIFAEIWYNRGLQAEIVNCVNYGDIIGTSCAGIGYRLNCYFDLVNCKNYGKINSTYGAEIAYYLGTSSVVEGSQVGNIINCKSITSNGISFLGTEASNFMTFNIKNCSMICKGTATFTQYAISSKISAPTNINGFEIIVDCEQGVSLFKQVSNASVIIKNVVIDNRNADSSINAISLNTDANSTINMNGIIVSKKSNSYYIGDDFKTFYVSWKTGKIGLKAIDGIGFYQGIVDESVLERKGYNKKEI